MGHHVRPMHILIVLIQLFGYTISLPINDKVTGPRLTRNDTYMYNTPRFPGRTLKAIDFDECEFGDTLQPYDETCTNGATNLLPCNPGQLKVAACIGQDGDTSRMCDPCPQKYYQSFYNKCTRCHECSECGPNEQISEPCTDETDTVCTSIIPPEPVTTISPKPNSTPLSQTSTRSITTIASGPTTGPSVVTTVSPRLVTYGNVDQTTEILRPETSEAENKVPVPKPSNKDVNDIALAVTASLLIVVLLTIVIILLFLYLKQRREIKDLRGLLRELYADTSKKEDSGLASSGEPQNANNPQNEYEMTVRTPANDSSQPQQERLSVQVHAEGENGSLPRIPERQETVQSSAEGDREENRSTVESHGESHNGNTYVNFGKGDERKDGVGGGDGEGGSNDDGLHQGGNHKESNRTKVDTDSHVHTPSANAPGPSTATHNGSNKNGDAPSATVPSNNSESEDETRRTNGDAPSTGDRSGTEDSDVSCATAPGEDNGGGVADPPKTLVSTIPKPKEVAVDEADPLMVPHVAPEVGPQDRKQGHKRKRFLNIHVGNLIKQKKPKKENGQYAALPQKDMSLGSKADEIVSEEFLDDLSGLIDLTTLDKLCREIGQQDKDVSNLRYTHQHYHGDELAFKIFMSIRAKDSRLFTYKRTLNAMRKSKNDHLVERLIEKYELR